MAVLRKGGIFCLPLGDVPAATAVAAPLAARRFATGFHGLPGHGTARVAAAAAALVTSVTANAAVTLQATRVASGLDRPVYVTAPPGERSFHPAS